MTDDAASGDAVTQQAFRNAMARLAAPVHVVTTDGPAGKAGTTATAVCPVTDDPPMLLVCLNRGGWLNRISRSNGVLAINALRHGQDDLSTLFAGRSGLDMETRFSTGTWSHMVTGAPVLLESLITFDCRIDDIAEVGTHSVMYCRVVQLADRETGSGLVYVGRSYRTT